tara:strand:- start:514 stop:915 length:402 start_codon:yes stop_codon:yes gene_type:complete
MSLFKKLGIDKDKFYQALRTMGKDGLKTKKMRDEWSEDNPTRNYCYMVSEFIYKYIAPKGVKHLMLKVKGEDATHHFLKWVDGTIVDLTAEQFGIKLDYSKARGCSFLPTKAGAAKNTRRFAELMGFENPILI